MDQGDSASGSLRTPTDRQGLRRSQYKSRSGSGSSSSRSSTPDWKSKFRDRCRDRLKLSRERLVSRFRQMEVGTPDSNLPGTSRDLTSPLGGSVAGQESVDPVVVLVKEAMDVEWEHMRAENANLPQLTPRRPSKKRTALSASLMDTMAPGGSKRLQCYAGPSQQCNVFGDSDEESEDIDYVLSLIDELTEELIHEEQVMIAQCWERDRQLEMELKFYQDSVLGSTTTSGPVTGGEVMCPICQKDYLLQDVKSIRCSCGFEINTIHDGLSLRYLREQLETCVTQHNALCLGKPVFSLNCNLGMQNLIMNCASCDFMYIIL